MDAWRWEVIMFTPGHIEQLSTEASEFYKYQNQKVIHLFHEFEIFARKKNERVCSDLKRNQ